LNTALTTDPQSLGFAADVASGNDAHLVVLLNQVRTGAFYQQQVALVPAHAIVGAFDAPEYAALTPTQYAALGPILSAGQVDLSLANVRTLLGNIFPNGGPTRAALVALSKRQGSYAEVLCGRAVTLGDVSLALRGVQ
jgi:hypothetical protein